MAEHEHDWAKSDFLVSVNDEFDGPAYRYRHLNICNVCGVLSPVGWVSVSLPETGKAEE